MISFIHLTSLVGKENAEYLADKMGWRRYDRRMKSQPDPNTTPEEKYTAFESDLLRALTFNKGDLKNLEDAYQREREGKPKPGPKPSSSGHAFRDKG